VVIGGSDLEGAMVGSLLQLGSHLVCLLIGSIHTVPTAAIGLYLMILILLEYTISKLRRYTK
jgi:hypothetical protein